MITLQQFIKKIPDNLYFLDIRTDNEKFSHNNDIAKLFQLMNDEFDELKAVINDLYKIKDIDQQQGDVLDKIGMIVKESRKGRNDKDYKEFLKTAILRNTSNGSLKSIADITKRIVKDLDFTIREGLQYDDSLLKLDGSRFFDGQILLNPNTPCAEPAAFRVEMEGPLKILDSEAQSNSENLEGQLKALEIPAHLSEMINDIRSAAVKAAIKPCWKGHSQQDIKHSFKFSMRFNAATSPINSLLDGQGTFDGNQEMNGLTGERLNHTMELSIRGELDMIEYMVTTKTARDNIAKARKEGGKLSQIKQIAVGTGGLNNDGSPKSFDKTRNKLYEEIKKFDSILCSRTGNKNTYKLVIKKSDSSVDGKPLSEIGLIDEDGYLIAAQTFKPKIKDSNSEFVFKLVEEI